MANKVKAYKRKNGSKVKAHIRKGGKGSSQARRDRVATKYAQKAFGELLKGTTPKPRKTEDMKSVTLKTRKNLKQLIRKTRKKNKRAA